MSFDGRRRQRGSATVLALGVSLAVLSLLMGALTLGSAIIASQRARAAADLAALAGAAHVLQGKGPEVACPAAALTAQANGAELIGCDATVDALSVRVSVPVAATGLGPARAVARAGLAPE